jgi:hypothetical protein
MVSVSACILTGPAELDQVISRDLVRLLRAGRAPRSLARPVTLTEAAQAADWLIVVCSPSACADPDLLNRMAAFRAQHGDQHILALLTAGEPAAAFPPALCEHGEPLAADVRAPSLRRSRRLLRTESLRLLAPMLGCAFDDLRQRRRERLIRRAAAISATALLLLAGAGLYMYARAAQTAAAAALARAETRKAEAATAEEATARTRAETGQAEAQKQTTRAEEQTQEFERQQALALGQRDQSLIRQSLLLADLSQQQTAVGNGLEGMRLALQGLPRPGADRPPVQQAEAALATALYSLYDATVLPWDFGPVAGAVYSPDGKLIAAATTGGTVRLVDAASGRSLHTLTGGHPAFSPDGTRVVTTAADGSARLWDVATDKETVTLSGHSGAVNAAAFSPDGQRIVTAGDDATAKVWNAATGQLLATAAGHTGAVTGAVFGAKGDRVFTGSADGTVRIWTADTGAPVITLRGHQGPITALAACRGISADYEDLVTVSVDGTARMWSTGQRTNLATERSSGPMLAVACSNSGSNSLAIPKSSSRGTPSGVIRILPGFKSRWITLRWCADSTAAHICRNNRRRSRMDSSC